MKGPAKRKSLALVHMLDLLRARFSVANVHEIWDVKPGSVSTIGTLC
jgi:hypothetical protein